MPDVTSEMELLQRIGTATREVQEAGSRVSEAKEKLQDTDEWKAYQCARNDWKLCKTILDGAVAGTVRFAQLGFDQQQLKWDPATGQLARPHGAGQLTAEQHLGALLVDVMQQPRAGMRPRASSIRWDEAGRGVLEEVAEQVNAGVLDSADILVTAVVR